MSRTSPFRTFRKANGKEPDTLTMRLLRKRARQIATREQFEDIVATARHPKEVRALLEPLLRPNLPCCASPDAHTDSCPLRHTQEVTHAPA